MSQIRLSGISKNFGDVTAVQETDLEIHEGEFFSLLGPSGSGKTTILKMIAGFLRPSQGSIFIGDARMESLPPERRDIGLVFQNYALFPHLTVQENVAFGLEARNTPKDRVADRVAEVLERTGLEGYETRRPHELSGGEQQRVAIARALVIKPKVLLLDEPLGALDRLLREHMQYWIKSLQNSTGVTTLYVTHDQVEALTMSDRVAVIHQGKIIQVDDPKALYQSPSSRFVADFMGDNNVTDAVVLESNGNHLLAQIPDGPTVKVVLPDSASHRSGDTVAIALRPEDVHIDGVDQCLRREYDVSEISHHAGRIVERIYRGSVTRYIVNVEPGWRILVDAPGRLDHWAPDAPVSVGWPVKHLATVAV